MASYSAPTLLSAPITGSSAGNVLCSVGEYTAPVTLAANDIIALCHLPADHVPVDFILESADLDTHGTPTITLTVAVLNADKSDVTENTSFLTESTVAQAGGVIHAAVVTGLQLASSSADRVIGIKCIAAGATKAAGKVRGTLLYRRK